MKWCIPAKTFFLGEYVAMTGGSAILLTTTPCFEVTLTDEPTLQGIHPESPAGRLWNSFGIVNKGLSLQDPYQGRGGLGASTAQFIGAYLAGCHLQKRSVSQDDMLHRYLHFACSGSGMQPSGYDLLAQSLAKCVFINRKNEICQMQAWPFNDLSFVLLHTGQKLATHEHLQSLRLPEQIDSLAAIVDVAQTAFDSGCSRLVIDAVIAYHQQLLKSTLVASHSHRLIQALQTNADVLAVKGCGAMGADVLLVLVSCDRLAAFKQSVLSLELNILATSENLS